MTDFWTFVVLVLSSLVATMPMMLKADAAICIAVAFPLGMLSAFAIEANRRHRENAAHKQP